MTQKYIFFILASISNPPSVPGVEIIPYLTKIHNDLYDDFSRRYLLVSRIKSNVPFVSDIFNTMYKANVWPK